MARRVSVYHNLILWNVSTIALAFTALLPRRLPSLELRGTSIAVQAAPRDANILSAEDSLLLAKIDQFIDTASTQHDVDTSLIRQRAELDHEKDVSAALCTGIPFEGGEVKPASSCPEYEFVASNGRNLVAQTSASCPILSHDEIDKLRSAVEGYWSNQTVDQSRFRYKRKGNREAYLKDVIRFSRDISPIVDRLLLERVYPWVRSAFAPREDSDEDELYVFSSLFIRYNATEDPSKRKTGQPLHKDPGFVSVNVMLNDDFEGGGTWFEDQITFESFGQVEPKATCPIKPVGPGHALAHYGSLRHAGSATTSGVRDILVIFISKRGQVLYEVDSVINADADHYCPSCDSDESQLVCRMLYHRMAIDQDSNDDEAWHCLALTLLEYESRRSQRNTLELAVACLEHASQLAQYDGKLLSNLAYALGLISQQLERPDEELVDRIRAAYQLSVEINFSVEEAGCYAAVDYESACLNFAIWLYEKRDFRGAARILSRIEHRFDMIAEDEPDPESRRQDLRDAMELLAYCRRQIDA
mmetsp:Transcript_3065/g.6107  ORF Transcript_3065/g.6107 Transcript_3065/m.6107 type:complete len:530 (+) Transcript_3065:2817-4406(+)